MRDFAHEVDRLLWLLGDINALTRKAIEADDFQELRTAIEARLGPGPAEAEAVLGALPSLKGNVVARPQSHLEAQAMAFQLGYLVLFVHLALSPHPAANEAEIETIGRNLGHRLAPDWRKIIRAPPGASSSETVKLGRVWRVTPIRPGRSSASTSRPNST